MSLVSLGTMLADCRPDRGRLQPMGHENLAAASRWRLLVVGQFDREAGRRSERAAKTRSAQMTNEQQYRMLPSDWAHSSRDRR